MSTHQGNTYIRGLKPQSIEQEMQRVILDIAGITLTYKKEIEACKESISLCEHEMNNAQLFIDSDNDEVSALAQIRYKFYKDERKRLKKLCKGLDEKYNLNVSEILVNISQYAAIFGAR